MLPDSARSELLDAAAVLGVPLGDSQIDALLGHLALLAKWNRTYNLTAVREPAAMFHHHLLDSLAVVSPLTRHITDRQIKAPRLLDVGSGAGLPGLVLAITLPQLQVTCVDAVGKKASFMRQAAAELQLKGVQVAHARVEELDLTPFDIITSRAFASLDDFTRLTGHLLAAGGCWMAMKAKVPDDEIRALRAETEVFHVEHLTVPGFHAERCLIWMQPHPQNP